MEKHYVYTRDLAVGYHGRVLIDHIKIGVRRGEILTLIGPNGAGKSTILKSIIRQLEPAGGAVYLNGRDMHGMPAPDIAKKMSVVMTEQMHTELMTCRDVVSMGRYPYTGRLGILCNEDRKKVQQALELVHAGELALNDFSQISDGQRQRILLARAICQEPEVIVLDEPTSFLDIRYKLELLTIIKNLVREKNLAVILSLHELDLAEKLSDTVVCVKGDRIDRAGAPEDIFTAEYIKELYGLESERYLPSYGSLELPAVQGKPKVFVIGGGSSGIPVYRRLQREGVPFIAGILHENDADYAIAKALAAEVVTERAYEPIGEAAIQLAKKKIDDCERVICTLQEYGSGNAGNRKLAEYARQKGRW